MNMNESPVHLLYGEDGNETIFFLLNCKVIILLFAGVEYTHKSTDSECVYYFYTVIHFSLYTFKHFRNQVISN